MFRYLSSQRILVTILLIICSSNVFGDSVSCHGKKSKYHLKKGNLVRKGRLQAAADTSAMAASPLDPPSPPAIRQHALIEDLASAKLM